MNKRNKSDFLEGTHQHGALPILDLHIVEKITIKERKAHMKVVKVPQVNNKLVKFIENSMDILTSDIG